MHTNVNHRRQTWRRWAEPWYVAYGLLGATLGGLVPIFIPWRSAAPVTPWMSGW